MEYITLTPAYGRDYKKKSDVLADFEAGKDFILQSFMGSGYINKPQIAKGTTCNIRYGKLAKVAVVKVS